MAYKPAPIPYRIEDIPRYLEQELRKIAEASTYIQVNHIQLTTLYAAPDKPQEGMIVKADGTTWNPGSGAGIYARVGGAWVKL